MIGCLPEALEINGNEIPINTDFRRALIVFEACDDPDLTDKEKAYIMLDAIIGVDKLDPKDYEEAIRKVSWYLDGGRNFDDGPSKHRKLMDWKQDEQLVFSAVNDVARCETREKSYIHWWTFLGYFNEIREGLFSQVLLIRQKKAGGKQLTKEERKFYLENKGLIDIKPKYSEEEQKEIDRLNAMLPE